MHGDIKPNNILFECKNTLYNKDFQLSDGYDLALIDFGISHRLSNNNDEAKNHKQPKHSGNIHFSSFKSLREESKLLHILSFRTFLFYSR